MGRSLVIVLLALAVAAPALADGDPASDFLYLKDWFVAERTVNDKRAAAELEALTRAAKRSGFPVKIAAIGSPDDLGSIPSLFGKPQQYADFLGQEIRFYYKGTLLVVMPQGYGLRGPGKTPAALAALRSVPRPRAATTAALADGARAAVRAIAAADGHPLGKIIPVDSSPGGSGGGSRGDRGAIVVAVALALSAVLAVGAFFAGRRWLLKPD